VTSVTAVDVTPRIAQLLCVGCVYFRGCAESKNAAERLTFAIQIKLMVKNNSAFCGTDFCM